MLIKLRTARLSLEYAALTAVIVLALIGMRVYLRRAFSGRFRELGDQIGAQYDPWAATGSQTTVISSSSDEFMVYEDTDADGENEYIGSWVHSVAEQSLDSTETIAAPGI